MRTRTLETDAGEVVMREWGDPTTQGRPLVVALHSMGPVSSGALYGCGVGPLSRPATAWPPPDLPGYGLARHR